MLQFKPLPCAPKACRACPWRLSNQGTPHPHGWYSKRNLARLWAGLRTGRAPGMSCHPTDVRNAVPDEDKAPKPDAVMHECTGALLLVAREIHAVNQDVHSYDMRSPRLSRRGILWWGFERRAAPVNDDPDIGYPPLFPFQGRPLAVTQPST